MSDTHELSSPLPPLAPHPRLARTSIQSRVRLNTDETILRLAL